MTVPKRQKADISILNTWAKNVISAAFKQITRPDRFPEERKQTPPLDGKSGMCVQGWKKC